MILIAHDVDFHSRVDSVRLAAVELFDELLFKLFHEERLARLRYGERGLYFMSTTEVMMQRRVMNNGNMTLLF